ncbi:Platelet-activating factor acetylhydrolase [Phlyctochytrium planicorne]|nr:Platelet-activating factor acetylhydrolase [Phlyctochytrium planicorne]
MTAEVKDPVAREAPVAFEHVPMTPVNAMDVEGVLEEAKAMGITDSLDTLSPPDGGLLSQTSSSLTDISSDRPSTPDSKRPSTPKKIPGVKLHAYPGDHDVGVCHFELPRSKEMEFGLMGSVFFPCKKGKKRAGWLAGPNKFYVLGYGDFVKSPRFLSSTLLNGVMKRVKMCAFEGVEVEDGAKMPVCIFSHGLAGNSTTYSSFVGILASRGFVVITIEHRDGSACRSAFNNYTEHIPYIEPSAEGMRPGENKDAYLKRLRHDQIRQRVEEVKAAVLLAKALEETGKPPVVDTTGFEVTDDKAKIPEIKWPELKGRLDLENLVMAGHSFGGATALTALQRNDLGFKCGVILDPWMFAVDATTPCTKPILSIQAQYFHWRDNIESFQHLYRLSKSALPSSQQPLNSFAMILGTKHQDVSDFPALAPKLMKALKVSGESDNAAVLASYDHLVSAWLGVVLGASTEAVRQLGEGFMVKVGEKGVELEKVVDAELVVVGDKAWETILDGIPESWEETKK